MKVSFVVSVSLMLLLGCKNPSSQSKAFSAPRANREQVIALLKSQGIVGSSTTIHSAKWDTKANEWFVIVQHADGKDSYWFVDSDAKTYHGSTGE